MTEQMFNNIVAWQNKTFPHATALSKVIHATSEVEELRISLIKKDHDRRFEYADCLLLLFGSAASDGMSYTDICKAIEDKMQINLGRKWGQPDVNGVVNHICEESLTKEQAIQALLDGHSITHSLFLTGEFISIRDGVLCDESQMPLIPGLFWEDRKGVQWETGWIIIVEKNK